MTFNANKSTNLNSRANGRKRGPKTPFIGPIQVRTSYDYTKDRLDGPRTNTLLKACEVYLQYTAGKNTKTIIQTPGVNRLRGLCTSIYNTIHLSREGGTRYKTGPRIAFQPEYEGPKANSYAASFGPTPPHEQYAASFGHRKKTECAKVVQQENSKDFKPARKSESISEHDSKMNSQADDSETEQQEGSRETHQTESNVKAKLTSKNIAVNHVKITSVAKNSVGAEHDGPTFRAAGYSDAASMMSGLLGARGQNQPCSTPDEAMAIITAVGDGTALHPKRFGDGSFVNKTTSSNILSLTPLNFTPGNTIVVFTPVLKSHKGAFVVQLPGGTSSNSFSWISSGAGKTLMTVVTPDRDAEELGTSLTNLYTKLTTSIPTIVGGTTIVTAQISQEMGEVTLNPMLVVPGKLASLAKGRHAPIEIIGRERHSIHHFSGLMPDNVVRQFNTYDPLNAALTRSSTSGVVNGLMSTTIESANVYTLYAPCGDTPNTQLGFFGTFGQRGVITPIIVSQVIWRSNTHTDGVRHLLFGAFTITVAGITVTFPRTNGVEVVTLQLVTTYCDATTVVVTMKKLVSSQETLSQMSFDCTFSTDGQDGSSGYASKNGIPIVDVALRLQFASVVPVNEALTVEFEGGVVVRYHDVPAVSPYLCAVITGAQVGAQLNIELLTHTEIKPDTSTKIAQFLSVTPDLPYHEQNFKTALLALEYAAFPMALNEGDSPTASAFGGKLKNFFGNAWRVASPYLQQALTAYNPALGALVPALDTLGKGFVNRKQLISYNPAPGQQPGAAGFRRRRRSTAYAASFSAGKSVRSTGFSFPVVSWSEGSDSAIAAIVEIVHGSGLGPSFKDLSGYPIRAETSAYTGSSHGLAFAMATLKSLGFAARPGLYSGEVTDFECDTNVARFIIHPVDLTEIKKSAYPELVVLTPEGWSIRGKMIDQIIGSDLFSYASTKCVLEQMPAGAHGSPWTCRVVMI